MGVSVQASEVPRTDEAHAQRQDTTLCDLSPATGKSQPIASNPAAGGNGGISQQPVSPQLCSTAPKLTLHLLLKSGNPCWTACELKAARRKLNVIGIIRYSDIEEVLLQGKGILNNRLRDHGFKGFASSTLERLLSTVNLEQERQRQAADEAKLNDSLLHNLSPRAASSRPCIRIPDTHITQNVQQPELTLHALLKSAKPDWTTNALEATIKKLEVIGIVSYADFEEVILQGKGILNIRLRKQGLKAFAPSTLDRLRSAVQSHQESQHQTTNSQKHEDNNGMQWYTDGDCSDDTLQLSEDLTMPRNSSSNKIKMARLDLSKVMSLKSDWEAQDTTRTVSTSVGSSPPCSPLSSHRSLTWGNASVMYYSIATP